MPPRIPRLERDWPTLPLPLFAVEDILRELGKVGWEHRVPAFRVRDEAALASAFAQPYQTFAGQARYPTVCSKAACLFRGIVKDHPLVDGNKRLAATTAAIFLILNGRSPTFTNQALLRYALRVARHRGNYPLEAIERWMRRNSEAFSGDRVDRRRTSNLRFYENGDPTIRWFSATR